MTLSRRIFGFASVCFYASSRFLWSELPETLGDAFEAWKIYEEIVPKAQRIFGDEHPTTINFKAGLQNVAVGTNNFLNDAERTRLAARKIILRFLRRCGKLRAL